MEVSASPLAVVSHLRFLPIDFRATSAPHPSPCLRARNLIEDFTVQDGTAMFLVSREDGRRKARMSEVVQPNQRRFAIANSRESACCASRVSLGKQAQRGEPLSHARERMVESCGPPHFLTGPNSPVGGHHMQKRCALENTNGQTRVRPPQFFQRGMSAILTERPPMRIKRENGGA
jgi:hypothetical protein